METNSLSLSITIYILVAFFPHSFIWTGWQFALLRLRFPDCFQSLWFLLLLFRLTVNLCRLRVFASLSTNLRYNDSTHSIIPIQSENRTTNWTRVFFTFNSRWSIWVVVKHIEKYRLFLNKRRFTQSAVISSKLRALLTNRKKNNENNS